MIATNQFINSELKGLYPISEIEGFTRIIFEAVFGWSFTKQVINKHEKISEFDFNRIKEIVLRLKRFEPIQYILGETEFYGLTLNVNPSVLIPRPETEELVDWIVRENLPENSRILDIGTGSGCIALALKSRNKKSKVSGIDISESALEVAIENAIKNRLEVNFFLADILNPKDSIFEVYDVIVSNPPYIRESEKLQMQSNVLEYEPENALFVSDNNPLVFYRSIVFFAEKHLADKGKLFFEINENLGSEMKSMLTDFGFCDIQIRNDINGKNRMICCRRVFTDR